jgi:hypothetical protein
LISDESHHITLHNHTAKDIEQFVRLRIGNVRQLIDINPPDLEELQSMIAKRSSGVFLWVVLVVRDLLDGLEPPFSMPEMKERLLLLPVSLDDFFQRILNKVHQQHRRFVARVLLASIRGYDLNLETVHFLWLLDQGAVYSRNTIVAQEQHSRVIPGIWRGDMCLRIQKTCGDFLDTINDTTNPRVVHIHRSVADFLKLPEIQLQLLRHAGWHESDISLALCRAFVSNYERGIITLEQEQLLLRVRLKEFMSHAARYESDSGKSCADLIYKLDSIFCSRPPASQEDRSTHWIRALIKPCNPNWPTPEAQALPFGATFYGLYLFVEQAIAPLTPQVAATTLNDLLRTLVLGCYHHEGWASSDQRFPSMSDVVTFLCGKGANPNAIVEITTPVATADRNDSATLTWTIWELYLQQGKFEEEHVRHVRLLKLANMSGLLDKWCVMESLIEGGADLECKLPVGCLSLQQAIERRLEKEFSHSWRSSPDECRREESRRVKAALLRRGYIWVEEAGPKK